MIVKPDRERQKGKVVCLPTLLMAVFGRVGNWRVRARSPHPSASFFLSSSLPLRIFIPCAHRSLSSPPFSHVVSSFRRTCRTPLLPSRCTFPKTLFPSYSSHTFSWPHRTFETANVCPVTYYSLNTSTETVCVAKEIVRGPFARLNCDSLCPTPTRKLERIPIFSRKNQCIFFLLLHWAFTLYRVVLFLNVFFKNTLFPL